MKTLNLTNQTSIRNTVVPYLIQLWQELLKRKEIWDTLEIEKRHAIINNEHDIMIDLAWDIYKKLNNNFFGETFIKHKEVM